METFVSVFLLVLLGLRVLCGSGITVTIEFKKLDD
jgi:hypothetical protein